MSGGVSGSRLSWNVLKEKWRKFYGANEENEIWRNIYNFELSSMGWWSHSKGVTWAQQHRIRSIQIRFRDNIDADLNNLGVRVWINRVLGQTF